MRLEVAGDVGGAEHLAADVAGDLALVPDHVRAQAVFGGERRRAGLPGDTTLRDGPQHTQPP